MEDFDPIETKEWQDAAKSTVLANGEKRAKYLLSQAANEISLLSNTPFVYGVTTKYNNTIPSGKEVDVPGNMEVERRALAIQRWNAMAIVARANKRPGELGGHISTFASSAKLYDIAFNHFLRASNDEHGGDFIFVQGHAAPGIYARAFLEGRLTEEQLDKFREEVNGGGLSSYPHPWLMPDFWQFPTVSMGLGPIQAIYQARFLKYLEHRELIPVDQQRVWCFIGDGESDEPETLGAIRLAGREKLDNLIFVINCNLQRLDGPVYGNGKIIQELEGMFKGANWNVIKVIWGSGWDKIMGRDINGLLQKRMDEVIDGEYQNYRSKDGAYVREHFFNTPELKALVADMTDDEIWALTRGGHDAKKVYNAYKLAIETTDMPSVVLAKTIKGYELGSGASQNTAHNVKKMTTEDLRYMRDRFRIPISDDELNNIPYYRPYEDSVEVKYIQERRASLGGWLPQRRRTSKSFDVQSIEAFKAITDGSGDREISTTMAFVRVLAQMLKDKQIGYRIVPIVADESRTFGMEGMFRQLGIYSSVGQNYEPVDKSQVMFYKEDSKGQILQEGINESGAMSSWIAAGSSYSNNNQPMLPVYAFYSMFGFQRVGDLAWAAGDIQARGFLIGGTAGRTTLNGEGLQHQDGHSHILASTLPTCRSYDPAWGYEVAAIMAHGSKEMMTEQKNVFYYITVMNEQYQHPAMPENSYDGIIKGMYLFQQANKEEICHVQLLGSGVILREVIAAVKLLEDFNVSADVWSVTSFNELRRNALAVERINRLHPEKEPQLTYIEQCLNNRKGPIVASTDYMKSFADQIRQWIHVPYKVLGTDGFGRSDKRNALRDHFEVDCRWVAYSALQGLVDMGSLERKVLVDALKKFGINPEKANPLDI